MQAFFLWNEKKKKIYKTLDKANKCMYNVYEQIFEKRCLYDYNITYKKYWHYQ